ncbi:protein kinase/lanthionine synthetase C family protein [Actinomadura madurae]|uniref:protein kinase/lanthionine synthetase C family protein n=1 Tax=Actinomadura madurae TaxID=1993 RepID=UPI0020272DE5|nr:protein kinase/lanthionine synthetase C family protein [Actinomadura madurae]URN07181.1 protein kinase/lanthionine synthetase C family protein [Actinomadura madurae]
MHGIPGVPRVHDYLSLGEHEFMVMDHVPGISLHAWLSRNYRNLRRPGDSGAAAGYLDAARQIMEQVRTTLTAIHDRGYAFNDLHPGNIMVDDDLIVSLIDFEAAAPCEVARTLGAPGFAAPDTLRGAEADRYSLGAVELFLYVPLSSLLSLCPAKATTFIAHARSQIGLAEETADELTASLTVPGTPPSGLRPADLELEFVSVDGPWDRHMAAIGASILASATPDRTDRLFPGDINQFLHGGGGVAFGAAGVIEALHAAGYGDLDPFLDWLETCTRHDSAPRLGLYDGLAGVCRALFEHGRTEAALRLYDRGAENLGKMRGVKLYDGLSGIGLVDLDFHRRTGDLAFLERAGRAAAAVASAIESGAFIANAALSSATSSGGDRRGNAVENFRGGLLYGWSGLALFMLHMYELDGERRWLNAARQAIQRDIDQCKEMPDGTLQMRNGGRVLPYLATGSAGVAIVADRFLRHAADDRLADAVPALCRASATELCIGSGLFNGMAGLIYTLRHMAPRLDWPDMGQLLDRAVQALNLFCLADERGLAFPGEQNLRASADLATGSAGVLRLLALLVGRTAEILPFLTAPSMERR